MAKENEELDFDKMSDEDFLKMEQPDEIPETFEEHEEKPQLAGSAPEEEEDDNSSNEEDPNDVPDTSNSDDDDSDNDESSTENEEDPNKEPETGEETPANTDPLEEDGKPAGEEESETEGSKPKAEEKSKDPDGKKPKGKEPVAVDQAQTDQAVDFYKKITAPFKADGKDFSVRTPEDAIRLMQQGVNYSRRMAELKPMKQLNRMLVDHGLDKESDLSFLIDISKGDKEAITKLLKDHNLDPMDLDTSTEVRYQAKSYAGSPQANAFRDALDETMAIPEGQALVQEIHRKWDDASKQQLQQNPSILGNLTEMKRTGDYQKIENELTYQKSMGYLAGVPFLQAFDQVGEAMRNVGALGQPQPAPAANSMGQLQSQNPSQGQPVASGARKAQTEKKPAPNPHLSSTPPAKQNKNQQPAEVDFGKMSDEDFLKMEPPS